MQRPGDCTLQGRVPLMAGCRCMQLENALHASFPAPHRQREGLYRTSPVATVGLALSASWPCRAAARLPLINLANGLNLRMYQRQE